MLSSWAAASGVGACHSRWLSTSAPASSAAASGSGEAHAAVTEAALQELLAAKLEAVYVVARDTSGGCGQFFSILVVSPQFEGKTTMAQHRCVVVVQST